MARTREAIESVVRNAFPALVERIFGEQLVSLTLYGSILKETFVPGASDVNALVIVSECVPSQLHEFGRAGYRMLKRYRITPLVLSRREFLSSADVFPMEYLDITERHQVLLGPDVTADLALDRSNLRHQVEHQLRGSLVALRQLAIAGSHHRPFMRAALGRELRRWAGSLSAVLRGLLRLKGVTSIPQSPAALVERINESYGLEPGPILELLRGGKSDSVALADALLDRLERLVEIVDGYDAKAGEGA